MADIVVYFTDTAIVLIDPPEYMQWDNGFSYLEADGRRCLIPWARVKYILIDEPTIIERISREAKANGLSNQG